MGKTIAGLLALGLALAFVPGASAGEASSLRPLRPAAGDGDAQRSDAVLIKIRSLHGDRNQCLDADTREGGGNGTRVQVWRCNGEPQQAWLSRDGFLESERFPGMCLDADLNGGGANGTRLQLWRCNDEPQQGWRQRADDLAIYNVRFLNDFNTVVDRDPAQVDGAAAQLWQKNFQSQQWWQVEYA